MRWITFFILLALMAALQVSHFLGVPHSQSAEWPRIEYLVILTVFYALFADDQHAPLCGLFAGLATDLLNPISVLGTSAIAMGLVAWAIVRIRLSIFRENVGSQAILTALAVLAYALFAGMIRGLAPHGGRGNFLPDFLTMTVNAAYSALAAPALFWVFFKIRPLLGFGSHGPRSR